MSPPDGDTDDGFQRKYGFSRADLEEMEQTAMDHDLALTYCATLKGLPRTVKERKMREYLEDCERTKVGQQNNKSEKYSKWMVIVDPTSGEIHRLEVILDSGSEANVITKGMANDNNLSVKKLDKPQHLVLLAGPSVMCQYEAEANWVDVYNAPHIVKFFVLDRDPNIQKPLLGRHFMEDNGDLLMDEISSKRISYTALGRQSHRDKREALALRSQVIYERSQAQHKRDRSEQGRGYERKEKEKERGNKRGSSSRGKKTKT